MPKAKAVPQVGISLPAVEEEVVGVGDRASVLTTAMAMLGAGRGNRDAEVVMKSPNLLTLPLVAVMGEVVVGALAVDEAIVPPTVRRMVKKARETSEVKAKVAVAGDARVEKTTITTKKTMEMKSTATTVRVSMAQSTTAKAETMETERTGKEREEDVQEQNLKPIQAQEGRVAAEEIQHMELGRKHQWAQKQNMTRKVTQRAAGCEDVTDLETRVALMRTATSL